MAVYSTKGTISEFLSSKARFHENETLANSGIATYIRLFLVAVNLISTAPAVSCTALMSEAM